MHHSSSFFDLLSRYPIARETHQRGAKYKGWGNFCDFRRKDHGILTRRISPKRCVLWTTLL